MNENFGKSIGFGHLNQLHYVLYATPGYLLPLQIEPSSPLPFLIDVVRGITEVYSREQCNKRTRGPSVILTRFYHVRNISNSKGFCSVR